MKITHLACTDAFAGVEQYIAYVSRQQAAAGHEVVILGGAIPQMRAAIDDDRVRCGPAANIPAAQAALLRTPSDIVHVHMTAAEIAAVSTKPLHRRPIVATLHFARPRGANRLRSSAFRAVPPFLDAQIAISEFVAERSGASCDVIPNGVPWGLPVSPRRRVVLIAQRLEHEKDTATALSAWARSSLPSRGWRLEIAGRGAEHDVLVELAAELDIADTVEFLGFVPDVRQHMTTASIFLATAPGEPFGLSVVEAMAAGTPIVAADGGAHRETVGSAHDAVLFRPGSVNACAAALDALGDDPARRDCYGAELQRRWAESFTLAHHCEQLEAVYRRVLTRHTT